MYFNPISQQHVSACHWAIFRLIFFLNWYVQLTEIVRITKTWCWEIWLIIHFNSYLIEVVLDYILYLYIISDFKFVIFPPEK
jgi:hypothetical protein